MAWPSCGAILHGLEDCGLGTGGLEACSIVLRRLEACGVAFRTLEACTGSRLGASSGKTWAGVGLRARLARAQGLRHGLAPTGLDCRHVLDALKACHIHLHGLEPCNIVVVQGMETV